MAATVWNPYPSPIFTQSGDIAAGAKAYFYAAGTSDPITTYADSALATPNSFPVVATASGTFAPIYLPYVDYRARVLDANGVLVSDVDGIANPTPASGGGGGGGGSVPDAQLLKTGDTKWKFDSSALDGFVRLNGRTIGSGISGASERANDDTQALFTYLWGTLPDSIATVATGRGASASADWAANKTIILPSMQGRAPIGADTMGGSSAGAVQVSTTANVTNGLATIVVASAAGLARNMYVIINGVSCGQINAISGTTVTLSSVYSGSTATGLSLRASFFTDAQTPGAAGGSQTIVQTEAELATHHHAITDPGHFHTYDIGGIGGLFAAAGTDAIGKPNTSTSTTGITINDDGQGLPTQLIQPGRIVTWFIKL